MSNRCKVCTGSGRVMGGGMIMKDCDHCNGYGTVNEQSQPVIKIDKESKGYKEAINSIKALDSSMTDDQAKDIFEKEFAKLDSDMKVKKHSKK
jgi:DnaJ-class molecular chaperone